MRDFRDAKAMAQTLREALAGRSVSLTHSESLELVARILGFRDWNVLSARIQSGDMSTSPARAASFPAGPGLPIVPLRDLVLFPDVVTTIFIGREKTKRAFEHALATDHRVLGVTQRRETDEVVAADALYSVGVIAEVLDLTPLGDGSFRSIIKSLERGKVAEFSDEDFLSAAIAPINQTRELDPEAFTLMHSVLDKLGAYLNIDFSSPPVIYARLPHIREPGVFADMIAPLLSIRINDRQDLLETADVVARLEKILVFVSSDRQAPQQSA